MKLKLIAIGLILFFMIVPFFLVGCANQPSFCPEVRVNFCPVR